MNVKKTHEKEISAWYIIDVWFDSAKGNLWMARASIEAYPGLLKT